MKRQVIFDDDQLFEMVNESARRVLRTLMTESLAGNFRRWFDSDYMDDLIEDYGNGSNEGMLKQIGAENVAKLAESNPEAFQAISQDPMLLAQIAGNPGIADKMASDPSFMTKLATNANVQSAFFANGPEQAMNFFSDQNMVNIMKNPNIDPQTRAQLYGMMSGQAAMDPMMMQQVMTQYGGNQEQGGLLGWLGIPQQPQLSPQQSMMMMQQAGSAGQQLNMMQAQLEQLKQTDPNNPAICGLTANVEMMKQQMQMYAPAFNATQDRYNTLLTKMKSGGALTQAEMQEFQMASNTIMNANMNGITQYVTPSPYYDDDKASGKTQNQNGPLAQIWNNAKSGKHGWLWDMIRGKDSQAPGAAIGNAMGNAIGAAKNMINGAVKNVNANQRQQTNRRKATPAAKTPAAAATPAATGTGNTPAVAATPAPAPQAPAARGMTPAASQPAAQSLRNPAMQSLQNQNRALTGMAAPINPANLNLQGVQMPRG